MTTPGQRIKERRTALGLSQGDLARKCGMAQSTLSEIEKGESKLPSAENLIKLAKTLGVTQAWIVTGRDGEIEILTESEERAFAKLRRMTLDQREALFAMIDSIEPTT